MAQHAGQGPAILLLAPELRYAKWPPKGLGARGKICAILPQTLFSSCTWQFTVSEKPKCHLLPSSACLQRADSWWALKPQEAEEPGRRKMWHLLEENLVSKSCCCFVFFCGQLSDWSQPKTEWNFPIQARRRSKALISYKLLIWKPQLTIGLERIILVYLLFRNILSHLYLCQMQNGEVETQTQLMVLPQKKKTPVMNNLVKL